MLPLRRILCPTDLGSDNRSALKMAGEMAAYFDAELTVLYVHLATQLSVWPYEGVGIDAFAAKHLPEEKLGHWEEVLASEAQAHLPPNLNLKLVVKSGNPAEVIIETSKQNRSDMIVLTPHHRRRLRNVIFGSTAGEVIRHSPCPVTTVHADQAAGGHRPRQEASEAKA